MFAAFLFLAAWIGDDLAIDNLEVLPWICMEAFLQHEVVAGRCLRIQYVFLLARVLRLDLLNTIL